MKKLLLITVLILALSVPMLGAAKRQMTGNVQSGTNYRSLNVPPIERYKSEMMEIHRKARTRVSSAAALNKAEQKEYYVGAEQKEVYIGTKRTLTKERDEQMFNTPKKSVSAGPYIRGTFTPQVPVEQYYRHIGPDNVYSDTNHYKKPWYGSNHRKVTRN